MPLNDRFGELIIANLNDPSGNWTMENTLEHPDDDKQRIQAEFQDREWT